MIKLLSSTSLLALALASPALAQTLADQTAGNAATKVSPVVVTATRLPTPQIDVASSITVVTANDIALKQEPTLPDVLKDVPGLNVVQTGGPGGQTSVFMRGTNSDHVKVLVDGIDVGDPSSPVDSFDFGPFLTPDIDRIEVLRGPQSGLYGSDAIGGVINVITKSGNGPLQLNADLEGGSFGTFNQSGGLAGSTGPLHYTANIEHFQSTGTPVTPLDLLDVGERRNNDSDDNITASTKLGYDVTSNFDLGLVARYTDTHLWLTGEDNTDFGFPDSIQSHNDTQQYHLRGTAHLSLADGRFDQTLGVAYSHIQSTDAAPFSPDSLFYGSRLKVDWQGDIKLVPGETLVLGAEHQSEAISQPIGASIDTESGYAELQSNPFENFNDTISVRYDSNSRFGGQATYRFAPTYFIAATGTKLKASVGTGFKAPSLSDLFESFPTFDFFANQNLRPEKSIGYDAGFEQYLLGKRVQVGATYFYNHITDLIDAGFVAAGVPPCPAVAPFGCEQEVNVGKAHTDGVESFVLVEPIETLSFRLDYTYTVAQDDILHEELVRRPRNKWNVDARWQATGKLSLDVNVVAVSSWVDGSRDFSIPRLKAPGYTTADLAANYDLTNHFTLYGRVTNLFDANYQVPFGFLRPSRGVYAGVKARF